MIGFWIAVVVAYGLLRVIELAVWGDEFVIWTSRAVLPFGLEYDEGLNLSRWAIG